MYNRTLDAFRNVAEEGSFSKAAEKMYISHTAVIKQVSSLESHLGVKLFNRSPLGVTLTVAGQVLYTETLQIMKQSEASIRKVQRAGFESPTTIRIGTSTLCPAHYFMELWDTFRDRMTGYSLQIISFDDNRRYQELIGNSFDLLIGAFDRQAEQYSVGFLPVGEYAFTLAVPRANSLLKMKQISLDDLHGKPLMMMEKGSSPINDRIRKDIQENHPEIMIIDTDPSYSLATFNKSVEMNVALLSLECWDRVHPELKNIPLKEDYRLAYGVIYAYEAGKDILDFIETLKRLMK